MKTDPGDTADQLGNTPLQAQREIRTCPTCGTKFTATSASGLCPVCILRGAVGDDSASGETVSRSEQSSERTMPGSLIHRFENYEVMLDEDGRPAELGRGAMGITYKAFDVDLRCPVALKVINGRLVGDESARRRFVREARAAASVRHPNIASVFRLGKSRESYFYVMEFVEGETLESLLKRSGRVDVQLALGIVVQVAAGLSAVHEQNLVHRDIKPTNVMVRLKDAGGVIVKIIDLGLAKSLNETSSGSVISTLGGFVGTPAFASPEQFAGVGVDIRSDLYSLGVTLWEMLTGSVPFHGSPSEVMHLHQFAPLPAKKLKTLPQPVVLLLETLLEKDPAQRFQSPAQLLKVMPAIVDAVAGGQIIDRRSLWNLPEKSEARRRKPTESLRAHDLYVRGMALVELLDRDANQKAIGFFRKAIDLDPNFALAYTGLARAYVEEESFGGEKSLLDSAVQFGRLAIALDPTQARGYQVLGRAYFMKGWDSQCDEALQKALELGPDDDRVNALAALRALAKNQFAEAYKFFRRARDLNPNETWRLYAASEILYRANLGDVADKWMEHALQKEANPERHRLMECYRMMWRRKFAIARTGFVQLPPKLQSSSYSVSNGLLHCAMALGDWPTVILYCRASLAQYPNKMWSRTYLAIAMEKSGQECETREMAGQILECGPEILERPAQPDVPWEVALQVAWACRFLERKDQAYSYLHTYLAHRSLLQISLGLDNPVLDVFKNDPEYNAMLAEMNQKFEIARLLIRAHEANLAQR